MAKQDGRIESESVHVFRAGSVDLARTSELRALCLGLSWSLSSAALQRCSDATHRDDRDSHEGKQLLALFIMLLCHPDLPPC